MVILFRIPNPDSLGVRGRNFRRVKFICRLFFYFDKFELTYPWNAHYNVVRVIFGCRYNYNMWCILGTIYQCYQQGLRIQNTQLQLPEENTNIHKNSTFPKIYFVVERVS